MDCANDSSFANVEPCLYPNENKFHLYLRGLYLADARNRGVGMRQHIIDYLAERTGDPSVFKEVNAFDLMYREFKDEIEAALADTKARQHILTPQKKIEFVIQRLMNRMMAQYKVTKEDVS